MSFSLGNLCGSMCDKLAENMSCTFNCSKSVVVEHTGDRVGGTINQLAAENFDFNQFAQRCHAQNSGRLPPDPRSPLSPQQEIDKKLQWLGSELLGLNPQDMSSRVEYVLTVSQVDLKRKFKKGHDLSKEEDKDLNDQVKKVQEFGSHAVGLWKVAREQRLDWESMEPEVAKDPLRYLRKKLAFFNSDSVTGKDSFSRLDIAIKRIFIDAVAQYPKSFKAQGNVYQSWDLIYRSNSTEEIGTDSSSSEGAMNQLAANPLYATPVVPVRSLRPDRATTGSIHVRNEPIYLGNVPASAPGYSSRHADDTSEHKEADVGVRHSFDPSVQHHSAHLAPHNFARRSFDPHLEDVDSHLFSRSAHTSPNALKKRQLGVEPESRAGRPSPQQHHRRWVSSIDDRSVQEYREPEFLSIQLDSIERPNQSSSRALGNNLSPPQLSAHGSELYSITPSQNELRPLHLSGSEPIRLVGSSRSSPKPIEPTPPREVHQRRLQWNASGRIAQRPVSLGEVVFSEGDQIPGDASPRIVASRLATARASNRAARPSLSVSSLRGHHTRGSRSADFRNVAQAEATYAPEELSIIRGQSSGDSDESSIAK